MNTKAWKSEGPRALVAPPLTVLVVEDDPPILRLFSEILTREGYQVKAAESAETALDYARSNAVDLALTDLRLPGMDGLTLIGKLKEDPNNAMLPVLAVTASHDPAQRRAARAAGAVDYIEKPVENVDLTARVRIHAEVARLQRELRESERLFRDFFEHAPIGKSMTAIDGRLLRVNAAFAEMLGYSREELGGSVWMSISHPDELSAKKEVLRRLLAKESDIERFHGRYLHKNGSIVWARITTRMVWDPAGKPMFMLTHIEDLSKEREFKKELDERRALQEDLINTLPVGVYRIRIAPAGDWAEGNWKERVASHYCVEVASSRFCEIIDLTSAELRSNPELVTGRVHPDDQADFVQRNAEAVRSETPFHWQGRMVRRNGDIGWVRFASLPRPMPDGTTVWTGILADITERKRVAQERDALQVALQVSQRMESLGRLASGIAHDLNNLLSVIMTSAEFLLDALPEGGTGTARKDAFEIKRTSQRASALVRRILAFSRRQVVEPINVNLVPLVKDLDLMLRRLLPAGIAIDISLPDEQLVVRADPGQVEQVLMNLVVNAFDAMPSGGRLSIDLAPLLIRTAAVSIDGEIPPGWYAQILVRDSGNGIEAAVLPHIFEPFFTTKVAGKGTGLGLSIVYGIVKQAGGHISVTTAVGQGTSFQVLIPRLDASPTTRGQTGREPAAVSSGATLLLVDDNEQVRVLVARVLRDAGYDVVEASGGAEALALIAQQTRPPSLLITDFNMPNMDGCQLLERLRGQSSNCGVICMSGYADLESTERAMKLHRVAFLAKPFERDALLAKVRSVLGEDPAPAGSHQAAAVDDAELLRELRAIPPQSRAEIERAAQVARPQVLLSHIERIRAAAPHVAERLATLLHGYDYGGAIRLLQGRGGAS